MFPKILRQITVRNYVTANTKNHSVARAVHVAEIPQEETKLVTSYICGPKDVPLSRMTLGQLLQRAADLYGDRTSAVFVHQNIRKTFHQILIEADKVAAGLLALDLKRGDRIGIWGPNSYEWLLTQWAAARAGLILVNINPAYRANELRYALNQVGVKALVLAETYRHERLADTLRELIPAASSDHNELLVCSPLVPSLKRIITMSDDGGDHLLPEALKWSDLLERAAPALISRVHNLQRHIHFNDPANIQFTSGTTGRPKGATLSSYNIVNAGRMIGLRLGYHERDQRLCLPLPLFHIFASGGVIASASYGASLVFPGSTYDVRQTVQAIQDEKCTMLYGTPTIFVDLLHLPGLKDYDVSSLTTTLMAGAPCPVQLAKSVVKELNISHFMIGYGMTETSSNSFMTQRTDSFERNCSSVGYVSNHFEIKIVEPGTGQTQRINTPGEIWARGYGVMRGYWNQPEKTAETITEDGWLRTGDIGVMDEHGYGQVIGRIKDMIIRGGENIYPREIEELLHAHPAVQEAQVIGVPDVRLGEELCAWIRRKPHCHVSEAELKAYCQERIAYFKVPRYWMFREAFPRTVSGKVQKFVMKDVAVKELGLS